jgi:hypothetical protein
MKNSGIPVEAAHDETPTRTKGHDFEPDVKSSGVKPDDPPTAFEPRRPDTPPGRDDKRD